ncbi:MAG: hypothetical protein E6J26_04430 [Chloroflexi bacterium]|nr:MAG: hypothetical protein E6J26_04430 [Chloroflexota bacterium]
MTPEAEVLVSVIQELERADVPYMVVGSFASGLWGRPRATHDADIVVAMQPEFATVLAKALTDRFYADEEFMRSAVYKRSMFNLIHFESGFKVDVWILDDTPYRQAAFARRRRVRLFAEEGVLSYVASAEDTILSKLLWYQQTNWQRDLLDAVGVYEVQQPTLDEVFLNEWAARLDLVDLLAQVRAEAALPPDA